MQRVIPVIGVLLVPAMLTLGAAFQPPAKPPSQVPPPPRQFQDEAPIRVRNGSVEIDTLRDTKWVPVTGGPWSQDTASPGASQTLIAEVRFSGGGKCTVNGNTISVKYGTKLFRVTRPARKQLVTPRADFDVIDSRNPVTLRAKTDDFVTEVKGTGSAKCTMDKKSDLREICIASTQIAIDNNCNEQRR